MKGPEMKGPNETQRYHVLAEAASWFLEKASDQQLEHWAHDPNCVEMDACGRALDERLAKRERSEIERQPAVVKPEELQNGPFDPRTEVSADAKHIAGQVVTHLWMIFVLLPFVVALLLVIVGVVKLNA
jgi:hypothetical protein